MGASSAIDPRTPCLIGVGQHTWHPDQSAGPETLTRRPEPLVMWEQVARTAALDAAARQGAGAVLEHLDAIRVVYCQSWPYDDPPGRLAERLGVSVGMAEYAGIGGTRPAQLLVDTAHRMAAGELDLALVVGGEALDTKRRAKRVGERLPWSHRHPEPPAFPLEAPFLDTEIAHEVFQAWLTFALFDIGRRAAEGIAPEVYRRQLGERFAPMTEVAARHPGAWFPTARSAEELLTPTEANRMVGYPYTKYLVAVMDVDMAAGVLLATHQRADDLGVPADRRVYLRGASQLRDQTYVAEHPSFAHAPAMAASFGAALDMAGVGIDEVAHLDLYSCFPASVAFACDALGLAPTDPRPVTVTGGLPYHGGPGSNYLSHALATMVDVLRSDPGSFGLVTGVGMHMTSHAAAVWSTIPPAGPLTWPDDAETQRRLDGEHLALPVLDRATGEARIVTYSVVHGRDGSPSWALLVCELPTGDRCYARTEDLALLDALEEDEWVGATVALQADGGRNVATLAH